MIVLSWARRRLAPFFAPPWVPKSLIGLVTFLALLVIATLPYVPERQVLRSGDVAKKDIEAPRTVDYIDPEQTAIRRRIAAGRVEPVYRERPAATAAGRTAGATVGEGREQLRDLLRASGRPGRAFAMASAVGQGALRANLVLDRAFTQTLRREAEEAVEPVRVRILRGEIIVRRGARITEPHLR